MSQSPPVLTDNQLKILDVLYRKDWTGPTKIAEWCGKTTTYPYLPNDDVVLVPYGRSSWSGPLLRRLVALGWGERKKGGLYRMTAQGHIDYMIYIGQPSTGLKGLL